ncbi:MAG: ABC transporter ATP-binding protein [Nitriliruptorales bacterium]|nr:ABC transporter ATP-binding protein [Nitriliruptorales bacterium]
MRPSSPSDHSPAPGDTVAPALRCRGLTKRFGDTVALAALDLEVAAGSVTALLGPSGCGKTTALRVVAGLEDPDAGTVEIDGRQVAGPGVDVAPEARRVGMVFQDYALFPHLTVAKNVAYGLHQLDEDTRRSRVAEVLEVVGLTGLEGRLPSELSGGQQQRVALARALAPGPRLVLLDEPFSNLDASLRASVREDVRRILEEADATAVFVTHDQEEALSLADEVAVMKSGRVHQIASPSVLYSSPATRFVAEFVGDADVIPASAAGRYFVDTPIGRLPTTAEVSPGATATVLRPESVRLDPTADGPGTVTAITYFGHDQLVHVELDDGTRLRSRESADLRLGPGDRVGVDVEGRVMVFGDDSRVGSEPSPAGA